MTMTLNASMTVNRSAPVSDGSNNVGSIPSPGARGTGPVGALALVPPGDAGGAAALLKTLQVVVQQKGPEAAIKLLSNTRAAGPLRALLSLPGGPQALAFLALSFTAGFVGRASSPRVQALATALKSISGQNLPPARAAQQIVQVLRAAVMPGKAATPAAPDGTAAKRQVQSLPTSLDSTRTDLKETARLLKLLPSDQALQNIAKGQATKVRDLETKVKALRPGDTVGSEQRPLRRLPQEIGDLSPWLQDQVRNHGMGFEDAVTITKNEWVREDTMERVTDSVLRPPKTCDATVETNNAHTLNNGRIETDSVVLGTILGSETATHVEGDLKVRNPTTNKIIGKGEASVPGYEAVIRVETEMTTPYDSNNTNPAPIVEIKGKCEFTDGTTMPAAVHSSTNYSY